jgi:hypothetical protein
MRDELLNVLHTYAVPDPRIVAKLPRSGVQLDYVGHAEITRILLEIDPMWTIEPVAYDDTGMPAVRNNGKMLEAAFWLTVLGHKRYCVGSVEARKAEGDLGKELLSDAIRNGAMRFGIALSLWSKEEWQAGDLMPAPAKKPGAATIEDRVAMFKVACEKVGLDPEQVADRAGVSLSSVNDDGLTKLRAAFQEMKA